MGVVFVHIGLSLDGCLAPDGMTLLNPGCKGWGAKWGAKWGARMAWLIRQQSMRDAPEIGPGGETHAADDRVRSAFERIDARIRGKRMFDHGVRRCSEPPLHRGLMWSSGMRFDRTPAAAA